MQVRAKIFTLTVLAALAVPVLSVLVYNIYIDPFQIFHKDFQQPTILFGGRGTDRYQQAGIINQYDIASLIIGNSHSANYLPSKLEKELEWSKVYSLTMDGAPLYEQSMIAQRALSKHAVEKVFWGFSVYHFMAPWDTINKKLPLKEYLYDNNPYNDLRFFLTLDLLKYERSKQNRKKYIRSANNTSELQNKEFNEATSWYSQNLCRFNRPVFVADVILGKRQLKYDETTNKKIIPLSQQELRAVPPVTNEQLTNYKNNLYYNLLPLIAQNPQTEFNFIFTAYPTLLMQKTKIENEYIYKSYMQILRKFVIDTHNFQNIKTFGFAKEKFTNDLRLYKDRTHFHLAVNNYIIEQIAQGNCLLKPDNIDAYISAVDEKVASYHLFKRWNPLHNTKISKSGYLSLEAARMLIEPGDNYSDEKITNIALQDTPLPKCAANIKRRVISRIQ